MAAKLTKTDTNLSSTKHSFVDVYNLASPDQYAKAMKEVSYRNPDFFDCEIPLINNFIKLHVSRYPPVFLDVCGGYGLNALCLKECVTESNKLDSLVAKDTVAISHNNVFGLPQGIKVIGLDIAENALHFGQKLNLYDQVICQNLELENLNKDNEKKVAQTDIVISTGSLSYITAKSIREILKHCNSTKSMLMVFWPIIGTNCNEIISVLKEYNFDVSYEMKPLHQRNFFDLEEKENFKKKYFTMGIPIQNTLMENSVCVSPLIACRTT